jgi:hypothetical protein
MVLATEVKKRKAECKKKRRSTKQETEREEESPNSTQMEWTGGVGSKKY